MPKILNFKFYSFILLLFILFGACKKDAALKIASNPEITHDKPETLFWKEVAIETFPANQVRFYRPYGIFWGNNSMIIGLVNTTQPSHLASYLYKIDPDSFNVIERAYQNNYFDLFKKINDSLYYSTSDDISATSGYKLFLTQSQITGNSAIDCGKQALAKVGSVYYYVNLAEKNKLIKGSIGGLQYLSSIYFAGTNKRY